MPGGQLGFLIFVNIFIFLIAFFLDFFEIAFIIIPLLAPVADKLGIDLIWFGVLVCANVQTSFMHPPFGFALFYLRGVAPPEIKSIDIYWGAVPWVFLQVLLVIILIFWPGSVTYWLDKGTGVDPDTIKIEIGSSPKCRRSISAIRKTNSLEHHAQTKTPELSLRGLPFRTPAGQVRVRARIMKVSKPYSATCHHRY